MGKKDKEEAKRLLTKYLAYIPGGHVAAKKALNEALAANEGSREPLMQRFREIAGSSRLPEAEQKRLAELLRGLSSREQEELILEMRRRFSG